MRDKKVSLFIVGQPKSGTTALAHQLSLHPDICMSIPKEPHYFATDLQRESDAFHGTKNDFYIRTSEQYHEQLFKHYAGEKVLGEASTGYLFSKDAAKNIFRYNPEAKIVISLRSPVDLLHSLHMQYVNETTEDEPNFETALGKEAARKKGHDIPKNVRTPSYLYYSERVKYAEQIKRFLDLFPPEHILIFTAEQFKQDNEAIYRKVLKLVGVDTTFTPKFTAVHESKAPRLKALNTLVHNPTLKKQLHGLLGPSLYTFAHKNFADKLLLKKSGRSALDPVLRDRLLEDTTGEVKKLEKLLDRDFSEQWGYKTIHHNL